MTHVVLFDLDGVLVDSRIAIARSINAALAEYGFPVRPDPELFEFIGPPLQQAFVALGCGELARDCVEAYRRRYRVHSAAETVVVAGIAGVLAELARGRMLRVATSKPRPLAVPLIEAMGLADNFDAVFGPSLEAQDEPKAVTIAQAMADLPPDARTVMIGDRRHDVAGAQAHGIPCIGVLWGIGDAAELTAAGAAALAHRPADLPALIERIDPHRQPAA